MNLSADVILANQVALAHALENERSNREIDLLDGHAVVESGAATTVLPSQVFDDLKLSGIAVVVEKPTVIARRRRGTMFATLPSQIEHVQRMEVESCLAEAERLRVPFLILKEDRAANLRRFWSAVTA